MVKSEGVILVSAPRRRRGCAIPQTQFPTNYANFPSPSTALRRSPHPDLQSGLSSALVGGQCDTRRREKQQFTRPPDSHAKTPAPKCDSNYDSNSSYFIWSPSCSWGPKSPDRQTDRRTGVQTVFTVLAAKFILFQAICHRFASAAKKDDFAGEIIYLVAAIGFYLFSCDFMNYSIVRTSLASRGKLLLGGKWFRGCYLPQDSVWDIFFTNFPLKILCPA